MPASFWNFQSNRGRKTAAESASPPKPRSNSRKTDGPDALSVSELTTQIDRALKDSLPTTVLVRGEVSNFKAHQSSGHLYFTLKDAGACIDCVMFRSDAQRLKFDPADGIELIASGRVGVYGQRGKYQLYVATLQPLGQGALELARQQIEAKLRALGLFDADQKKPLPRYPRRITIITSTGTAALQDILKVLRRFPFLELSVYHVPVQGEGAAPKIAAEIKDVSDLAKSKGGSRDSKFPAPDLMILARGGGSLEDLWAFNEEVVARAVAASLIPIISGIGHEIDVSIADLAADYHAHTPTEAAQVAVMHWRNAADAVDAAALRLGREVRGTVADARRRVENLARHELFRRPLDAVDRIRQRLDDREQSLALAVARRLTTARARLARIDSRLRERHPRHLIGLHTQRITAIRDRLARAVGHWRRHLTDHLAALSARAESLNPELVLKRGYSMTLLKKSGQPLRDATAVRPGDRILTRLANGQIESTVQDSKQLNMFEG